MSKEKTAKLAELVGNIDSAVLAAEKYAKKHNLHFHYSGPDYGMGGWFNGEEGEWSASSQNC